MSDRAAAAVPLRGLPAGVWAMGFGSLLMDVSSELVHSLLPMLVVGVLGASMATLGVLEGIGEATAAFVKASSGALSDRLRARKWLMVSGYLLSALSKPLFPLAASVGWVLGARFADRVGKGIRGAPRDALIADLVPPSMRGAAYGLRQALDSVGALVGPLLAMVLMALMGGDLRAVLWVAVVPAIATVVLLAVAVREPSRGDPAPTQPAAPARPAAADAGGPAFSSLHAGFWAILVVGALFTLARFSEAFLILRGQQAGLSAAGAPAVMVAMNLVYALVAYPAGKAADRVPARRLLLAGLCLLVLADLALIGADGPAWVFVGASLWGAHMGVTQGLLSKLVAGAAPAHLRGTAFGLFHLVTGVALLLASVIAGVLWQSLGAGASFAAGAAFAALAAIGIVVTGVAREP